jgi:hypothetical protein
VSGEAPSSKEQIVETNAGDCQGDEASASGSGALYAMVIGNGGSTREQTGENDANEGRVGCVRELRRSGECDSDWQ